MNHGSKVISMVPSWTETLIECGINVVGRTRYCLHPEKKVSSIPIVGGTKDIQWAKIKELQADIILVDKEENPKKFAEECPIDYLATHVDSLDSAPKELALLAEKLQCQALDQVSQRYMAVLKKSPQLTAECLPGVLQWVQKPQKTPQYLCYLIWRKPWMAVGRDTFIGSHFQWMGLEQKLLPEGEELYPELEIEGLPQDTLLMFSSEPYPFGKYLDIISAQARPSALIDGESWSWFGLRNLQFLESITG